MILPQYFQLLAVAFAGALVSYVPVARQKGWPVGALLEKNTVPAAVWFVVLASVVGQTVGLASSGKVSWWWLLVLAVVYVVGPAIVAMLKSWTAVISLILAPVFAAIAFFVAL